MPGARLLPFSRVPKAPLGSPSFPRPPFLHQLDLFPRGAEQHIFARFVFGPAYLPPLFAPFFRSAGGAAGASGYTGLVIKRLVYFYGPAGEGRLDIQDFFFGARARVNGFDGVRQ